MSESWKQLDLQGQGLQSANLKLVKLMKRRRKAYVLWLLAFPFGQHRAYLDDARGAWGYRLASFAAVIALAAQLLWLTAGLLLGLAGWALYDLYWIERRVIQLNKALRVRVYLNQGNAAPANFHGRYAADAEADFAAYLRAKESEQPGHGATATPHHAGRLPSFAEQEALLRELARRKQKPPTA